MGKRQIGEMQPFELVITLVIADLACIPMADISIPILYGVVSILALFVLHQIVTLLDQSSQYFKKMISGKPTVVINRNGVDFHELRRNNLDLGDLIEAMRSAGYFSLDDVEYAIFEASGKFSGLKKNDNEIGEPSLPLLFINEGKLNHKNIKFSNFTIDKITEIVENQDSSIKKVQVMTIDSNGKVYFQAMNHSYKTFHINLPENSKW
jgi:uncharacterized membrane protein YcaP (DUF421 family)